MLSTQMQTNAHILGKRKNCSSGSETPRRLGSLFIYRQELASLMGEKQKWLDAQRKASLLVSPYKIDEWNIMPKFADLFRKVAQTAMPTDQHHAQMALIEQIVQESIIIEWPKMIWGLGGARNAEADEAVEVDHAPLIHRARNVVKCRTSHPTMRVRVCAIATPNDEHDDQPPIVEAFFRATLVKLSTDSSERQVAGRLILTQREGTPATKSQDQNGAIVNTDGRLIASQAAPDVHSYILLEQYGEVGKTTSFKYEQGALCATFPEMGVTLNSMVDRRQLATRYAIQVEAAINIDNTVIVKHTVLSHPFLIAITNDQTEPLLTSIFWQRLLDSDQLPEITYLQADNSAKSEPAVSWRVVQEVLRNFVKAQYPLARSLDVDELLHLQCMLFLPRISKCHHNDTELDALEFELFKNVRPDAECSGAMKLINRLRREIVADDVLIEKRELMQDKCVSLADQTTELRHSLWQWMYRATEMIMDVGHKLCPSPATFEKKCKQGAKAKKQSTSCDDYQTMLSLFNSRIITFSGMKSVLKVFKTLHANDMKNKYLTKTIMIRFCDENAAHLSFAFNNPDDPRGRPLMGSLSSEQIKDFKQGLPEVLMDESFPKQHERIVRFEFDRSDSSEKHVACIPKKSTIFHNYNTLRLQNDCIRIQDSQCVRINPLTGEKLEANGIVDFALPNPLIPQLAHLQQQACLQLALQSPIFLNLFNTPTNSDFAETEAADASTSPTLSSNTRKVSEQSDKIASVAEDVAIARPQIVISSPQNDTPACSLICDSVPSTAFGTGAFKRTKQETCISPKQEGAGRREGVYDANL
uniref:Uncharacterized protein n=1 Tax=Parascaris univalens TaxID=6257 RepID=A0A915B2B6_PARUN